MNFNSIEELEQNGFAGFKKISFIKTSITSIPDIAGIYMILNTNNHPPEFLLEGTGGHFKGKNPNVSLPELKLNWIENTIVVYIGKAGGEGSSATLRSRLSQYLRFGQGKNVGHWGGRYIWQLKNSDNLLICWKPLTEEDPRLDEAELIQQFIVKYGKRPFANLVG